MRCVPLSIAVMVTVSSMIGQAGARACNEIVIWSADLKGTDETPAVATLASGKATITFDFQNPVATFTFDTKQLKDVQKIELRLINSTVETAGPALVSLYDAKRGPYSDSYTVKIGDTDVIKQSKPSIQKLADIVAEVTNGMTAVVVATKEHPDGELAGRIAMHKYTVFSDDPNSKFHDPALHHMHEAAATAPSTAPAAPVPSTPAQTSPPPGDQTTPAPTTTSPG